MNLQEILESFNSLNSHGKVKLIYEKLNSYPAEYRIHFLLAIINDENTSPIVLAAAIKHLPKLGYLKPGLIQRLKKNPHPAVSQAAQRALKELSILGKKEKQTSKQGLGKKETSYRKQKRLKLLKEMVKIKASWVPKVLLEELEDPRKEIQDFIIKELAQTDNLNLNTLHQKLLSSPWYIRCSILKILANKKNPISTNYIEEILDDPNSEVRRIAAQTLGEIGGDKASGLLVKFKKDKNPYVKKASQEALEKTSTIKFT